MWGREPHPIYKKETIQGKCPSQKGSRPPLKNSAQPTGRCACAQSFCLFHCLLHSQFPVTSKAMRTSTVKKVFRKDYVHDLKAGHKSLSQPSHTSGSAFPKSHPLQSKRFSVQSSKQLLKCCLLCVTFYLVLKEKHFPWSLPF